MSKPTDPEVQEIKHKAGITEDVITPEERRTRATESIAATLKDIAEILGQIRQRMG